MPRNLVNDGVITLVSRIANLICIVGVSVLTARVLGPHGRGIYAFPVLDAALVSATFPGLTSSVSYFMLNKRVGRGVLVPAFLTAGIFVAAGSVVVEALAVLSHQPWAALPAIVSLPFSAMMSIALGMVIGVKKVRFTPLIGLLSTLSTFVLMIFAFKLVAGTPTVAITVWLVNSALAGSCVLAGAVYYSKRLIHVPVPFPEFLRFALKVGALNVITLLNYRVDVYIVAIMTSPATLGIYTIAVAAAESLQTVTQVATIVTAPHIGSLDRVEALKLTSRCVRNNTAIAALLCLAAAVAAPVLIHLFYGSRFMGMVPSLRVLLIGVVALSGGSALSSFFTLKMGKPEVSIVMASISAVTCFALTLLLLPRVGILGAAIGTASSYIFGQAISIWYFCRDTGAKYSTVLLLNQEDLHFYRNVVLGGARRLTAALSPGHSRP